MGITEERDMIMKIHIQNKIQDCEFRKKTCDCLQWEDNAFNAHNCAGNVVSTQNATFCKMLQHFEKLYKLFANCCNYVAEFSRKLMIFKQLFCYLVKC